MGSNKRRANTPVRWQPRPELTMAATLGASASLLGGGCGGGNLLMGRRSRAPSGRGQMSRTEDITRKQKERRGRRKDAGCKTSGADMVPPPPAVERNLLSLFQGDVAKPQSKSARPAPPLALSLRVGSEEEEETQNRSVNATIRGHDDSSHPSLGRRCSGPGRRVPQQPVQAASPSFRPLSPPPWLAVSIGPAQQIAVPPLRASAGAPPQMRAPGSSSAGAGHCDMCRFYEALVDVLRGQLGSSREELERERRKVWQLQLAVAAASPAGGGLACPACWVRPSMVVLAPHDERLHLCLCRRCSLAATRGDPSIACPRCAVARARAAAPR